MLRHICRHVTANYATQRTAVVATAAAYALQRQQLHQRAPLAARIFLDHENQYAHNVLADSLKPYQIFRTTTTPAEASSGTLDGTLPDRIAQPTASATATERFNDFCTLVEYCVRTGKSVQEEEFTAFIESYCDATHQLSDEQLLETLRQIARLPPVESTRAPNYMTLWNTLDIECCHRIEQWSTDQLLLVCDAWYVLGLARIGDFVWDALRRLGRKVRKMQPEQLVQSMFLCNVMRRPVFGMFDFEVNLARCANEMSLAELGVMSMGFFKTQTPIRNPELIESLYARLQAELDTVEDITLVAILKVLRYSSKLPQADTMMRLLEALCGQVERISLLSCLHVALLGCDLQTCHDELLERILQRFDRELEMARLKDIERICLVMALFNYTSPTGVSARICARIPSVLRQPKRMDEILKHPRCYTNCLHFLTQRNAMHDIELLSAAFEPRFVRHAHRTSLLGREYFHLDSFIKINLSDKDYAGTQLTDKQRRTMGKYYTQYIPTRNPKYRLNSTDRILLEIKECAATLFRDQCLKHVLPQYERADLVICYDRETRRPLPLAATCPEDYSGVILTRDELLGMPDAAAAAAAEHIDTIVVVVAGWNNVVRDKSRNTGLFDMKLQQLQLLGHKPVVIYWHEWRELETAKDRQQFLKRRLATVVQL